MKIDRNMTIGGLPVKTVRDFLRKTHHVFLAEFAEHDLGMSRTAAGEFLEALQTGGWIEPAPKYSKGHFQTTVKGNALSLAKFVKRIDRARADELVAGFKQRCAQVNGDPYYLCSVKKAVAFGSYARGASDVGDIDLFVWTEDKEPDHDKAGELSAKRAAEKMTNPNWFQMMAYGSEETLRFLKARSPYISICRTDEANLSVADKLVTIFESEAAQ